MNSETARRLRPVEHFTGRSVAGLATLVVAATGFAALLVLVRLQWQPLETADRGIAEALNRAVADRVLFVKVLETVTGFGGNAVIWWLITVFAACLLIRRQPRLAGFAVIAGAGALILIPLVKGLVMRMRPDVPVPIITAPGNSFPSGHTLNATVFYGVLLLVLLPAVPRRLRGWAVGLGAAMVLLIGFSRAALGVHYVSDVVGGWLLGVLWLATVAWALRLWRRETGAPERGLADGLEPEAATQLRPVRTARGREIGRAAAWLAGAWLLVVGMVAALGALVTAWAPAFDEAPSHWIAARRTAELTRWSQFFSDAGNTHMITLGIYIIAPLAVAWTLRWRPAVFLVVLLVGEVSIFVTASLLVGRDRPYVTMLDGQLPTSSFPSGHVAATVCLYAGLAVLVVPRTRGWLRGSGWLRTFAVALAVFMPLAIAVSRIYRGAHHPFDVLGGMLLAGLWLTAVTLAVRPNADLREPGANPTRPHPAPANLPAHQGPPRNPAGGSAQPGRARRGRLAVVVNPTKAADKPGRRREIEAAVTRAGRPAPAWWETTAEDPGGGQTRRAVDDGADVILAAGGDGTVMSCANALVGTDVALAVLPMGTGNLLARNLGLPMHVDEAVAVAVAGGRRRLDVGVLDGRCFLIMAGMGFDAHLLHDAPAQLKARIGWPAYGVAAIRHLCATPMTVEISLDHGPVIARNARTVLVGNVGRLQGGLRLLPDAVPDDGILDVAVVMPPRRRHWLALAWALLLRRRTMASLEVFRARHVEIRSDQVQPRELDGDLIEPSFAMTITVRPGALLLCVPEHTDRTRHRAAETEPSIPGTVVPPR